MATGPRTGYDIGPMSDALVALPPDPEALRDVIAKVFPDLASGTFTLQPRGWDSVAVEVDDRLIFKFPRHDAGRLGLVREAALLAVIRPAVTMPTPNLSLRDGPPLFSRHDKLRGGYLEPAVYAGLPEPARDRLAHDIALFYAQLHTLPVSALKAAGAGPIKPWLGPDDILRLAWPILTEPLRRYAERTIAAWRDLPPDPHGRIYGFFDGHGWNMAFSLEAQRLNGVYDFGDSGFGELHQEFIYSNMISPNLTVRIIDRYEALTGLLLDRGPALRRGRRPEDFTSGAAPGRPLPASVPPRRDPGRSGSSGRATPSRQPRCRPLWRSRRRPALRRGE
jgi:hypothetical protein